MAAINVCGEESHIGHLHCCIKALACYSYHLIQCSESGLGLPIRQD